MFSKLKDETHPKQLKHVFSDLMPLKDALMRCDFGFDLCTGVMVPNLATSL